MPYLTLGYLRKNKSKIGYLLIMSFSQMLNMLTTLYYSQRTDLDSISQFTWLSSISSMVLSVLFFRLDVLLVVERNIHKRMRYISYLLVYFLFLMFLSFVLVLFGQLDVFVIDLNFAYVYWVLTLLIQGMLQFINAISNAFAKYIYIALNNLFITIILSAYYFYFDNFDIIILFKGIFFSQLIVGVVNLLILRRLLFITLKNLAISGFRNLRSDWLVLKKYFFMSTPMTFLNSYIQQFPVFYLRALDEPMFLYYFFLYSKFILAPLSLILNPLSQVLLKEFSIISYDKIRLSMKKSFLILLKLIPVIMLISWVYVNTLGYFVEIVDLSVFIFVIIILLPSNLFASFVSMYSVVIPSTGKLEYEVYWKLPVALFLFLMVKIQTFVPYNFYTHLLCVSSLTTLVYIYYYYLLRRLLIIKHI
jgi:hypothetical protein